RSGEASEDLARCTPPHPSQRAPGALAGRSHPPPHPAVRRHEGRPADPRCTRRPSHQRHPGRDTRSPGVRDDHRRGRRPPPPPRAPGHLHHLVPPVDPPGAPVTTAVPTVDAVLRSHAEDQFAAEIDALARLDDRPRPPQWQLSPWAVVTYLLGDTLPDGT